MSAHYRSGVVINAGVAQSVEQLICNQQVGGSSPSTSSTISYGGIPEWPKGTDCKSAGNAFGGSNPPSPTKTKQRNLCFVFLFLPRSIAGYRPCSRYAASCALPCSLFSQGNNFSTVSFVLLYTNTHRLCLCAWVFPLYIQRLSSCQVSAPVSSIMPSSRIFRHNVVLLIPSTSAAPFLLPPEIDRASSISRRILSR